MKINNEYIDIKKIQEINVDEFIFLFDILSADDQEEFLNILLAAVSDDE